MFSEKCNNDDLTFSGTLPIKGKVVFHYFRNIKFRTSNEIFYLFDDNNQLTKINFNHFYIFSTYYLQLIHNL